jgi:hypothetical protein
MSMAFVNTIDKFGDEATMDMIIERTITEYCDNSAQKIGQCAFYGCSALAIVYVPNVASIEASAMTNCTNLAALILRSCEVVTLANTDALAGSAIANGTGFVYVPSAILDSYKAATNWSTYAVQIRAIEDYPDITGG